MSNQNNGFTEEELQLMEAMEDLIAEMKTHPEIADVNAPASLREELFRDIREYEAEKAKATEQEPEVEMVESNISRLTEEEMELIRLGKKYKKSKKNKKLYVLIAAAVLAMGLGITSMGGPERVMERFGFKTSDRDQVQINSEGTVDKIETVDEEAIYQQIEDEYGLAPVKLDHLPKGILFLQGDLHEGMQAIQIYYGSNEKVNITYVIRPNYRGSSLGIDVEDEVLKEYVETIGETDIQVKKYKVSNSGEERWTAEFNYEDTQYYIMTLDIKEEEVKKIINNLYFF